MNDGEMNNERVGKEMGECGGKGNVNEGKVHNLSHPPSPPCHNDGPKNPLANDVPKDLLPPTRKQMDRMIGDDYTLMLHLLARGIRERMEQGKLPTDDERANLRLLDDLKRSYDFTQKFAEHIKANPSMLITPGSMGGAAAQKLRNLETQLRKTSKKDSRKSSTPPKPPSDEGFSLPA